MYLSSSGVTDSGRSTLIRRGHVHHGGRNLMQSYGRWLERAAVFGGSAAKAQVYHRPIHELVE